MRRSQRAFTIAEMLTVLFVVGLMLSAVAFAMPLFMRAPLEAQSQVDNVESAALALYKVQRDVRQSDVNGIYNCSLPPAPVCAIVTPPPPTVTPGPTQALVLVTADNPNGLFQVGGGGGGGGGGVAGYPKWQGFIVYWLTPNSDGTSQALHRAFYADSSISTDKFGQPVGLSQALAEVVLAAAMTAPGSETVAQDVAALRTSVDSVNNIAHLQVDGGDTTGNRSSLDLTSNSYVRN
jgi:type II secretory pathway pseudopilin PulG